MPKGAGNDDIERRDRLLDTAETDDGWRVSEEERMTIDDGNC